MTPAQISYLVLRITPASITACRALAAQGGCFTIMNRDQRAGHRLVLALNTGSRGRAIFIPGDPTDAGDQTDALMENARCWPDQTALILSPASP